jgi:hypothetical protein
MDRNLLNIQLVNGGGGGIFGFVENTQVIEKSTRSKIEKRRMRRSGTYLERAFFSE